VSSSSTLNSSFTFNPQADPSPPPLLTGHQHLLSETTTYAPSTNNSIPSTTSRYSTTVVRSRPNSIAALPEHETDAGGASSVLTIKNTANGKEAGSPAVSDMPEIPSEVASPVAVVAPPPLTEETASVDSSAEPAAPESIIARPASVPTVDHATPTSPTKPTRAIPPIPASAYTHRFSFVKPVGKPATPVGKGVTKWTDALGLGGFYGAASPAADKASPAGGEKTRCSVCKHVSSMTSYVSAFSSAPID
jgi:hypothetical protein